MNESGQERAAVHDPIGRRVIGAAVVSLAYGAVWWFGFFRPLNPWVNGAIIATVLLCTLPPARVRSFVGAAALLGLAAVMHFEVRHTLMAIALVVFAALSLADGVYDFRSRGRRG
ncbi:MAG: hypothetical protein KIS87_14035 [Phycisphaeraceae bacterium]|nr:hypothetical protein [Phycisphaeraceae bacterium]